MVHNRERQTERERRGDRDRDEGRKEGETREERRQRRLRSSLGSVETQIFGGFGTRHGLKEASSFDCFSLISRFSSKPGCTSPPCALLHSMFKQSVTIHHQTPSDVISTSNECSHCSRLPPSSRGAVDDRCAEVLRLQPFLLGSAHGAGCRRGAEAPS